MSDTAGRPLRAGGSLTDLCRACKAVRDHTVMAVDGEGRPLRVVCDFCGSQHHYRGGGEAPAGGAPLGPRRAEGGSAPRLVQQERNAHPMSEDVPTVFPASSLEALLRRVLREELGISEIAPAPKWRGGQLVLRPGKPGLQEKTLPIDALFHKVVMIRNRLRTLEQQLNAAEIPEDLKLRLQAYVTGCYGSLTSFNVLFAEAADQFKGSGGD
jgi:hypothetical protein